MKKSQRLIFGVIAARPSDIEQREILKGIIEKAQTLNIDIVILSNIYNPNLSHETINTENDIYNLLLSNEYDGFILISEVIINTKLQQQILSYLRIQSHIPIIVVGTPQPEFVLPNFHFINTSDEDDFESITNHLIDIHGFTDIDMLTGFDFLGVSHKRVDGYKRALEKHGIAYNKDKVYFGDFWMTAGCALAKRYINNELPLPQAIVCGNDYTAYGILDEFIKNNINVPEQVSIIGYEYIRNRHSHSPLLTTYQRNRKALGKSAVNLLLTKLKTGEFEDFIFPSGKLITGDSCTCGVNKILLDSELDASRQQQNYDYMCLFDQLEQHLTKCRNLDDFIRTCHNSMYLIRNVNEVYICLYENWYDNDTSSENMVCRAIIDQNETPITYNQNNFSAIFKGSASAYYFCPLFFAEKMLGYVVLKYITPDSYDYTFRNWLKLISNELEFLNMKNDIQYLTMCQNLSEERDTLTGLYNENGFKKTYLSIHTSDNLPIYIVGLKICIFDKDLTEVNRNNKISAILDIAEAIRQFAANYDICSKVNDNTFFCIVRSDILPNILIDKLKSIIYQHETYIKQYGMDSFVCCAIKFEQDLYSQLIENFNIEFEKQINTIFNQRKLQHYNKLLELRSYVYLNPCDTFDTKKLQNQYSYSPGHLRVLYKQCFNVSFHQDCISARIAKAKYYLSTTSLNISTIADKCGYLDIKYFMRQFLNETGFTINQYKKIIQVTN